MPRCQLCYKEGMLCDSHIVPEFLYKSLYNNRHQFLGVVDEPCARTDVLQKGIREKLFCVKCEQYINDSYEKPFRDCWIDNPVLPNSWVDIDSITVKVPYITFKLFHLSVLYRAGVSKLPMYSSVALGCHLERIRQLLLSKQPGVHWQYPVFGYAIVHHQSRQVVHLLTQPEKSRFKGHTCYGMIYAGVRWWISVSSHVNASLCQIALQPDGSIPIHAEMWNDVPILQDASKSLRKYHSMENGENGVSNRGQTTLLSN